VGIFGLLRHSTYCHSEPFFGEESAVVECGNAAGEQQIPPFGQNDKMGEGRKTT
jgi:hypothetical protein